MPCESLTHNNMKILAKILEIKAKYPNCDTIAIESDFSKMTSMKQYRDLVANTELKDLDIGVLCLNAGLALFGPVDLVPDHKYENVWNVTGLHNVYLLKALVQKLLDRDKRVAVLFTSSMASEMLMPGI